MRGASPLVVQRGGPHDNVCGPEFITITENAIIPLKERVVDNFFDPLKKLLRIL